MYIFQFDCYKKQTPQGKYDDNTVVDVFSDTLEKAMETVKSLIKKENYSCRLVMEDIKPSKDRPKYLISLYGYYLATPEGALMEAVQFQFWDNDPINIVERAKKIVSKKFYYIKSIVEKIPDEEIDKK